MTDSTGDDRIPWPNSPPLLFDFKFEPPPFPTLIGLLKLLIVTVAPPSILGGVNLVPNRISLSCPRPFVTVSDWVMSVPKALRRMMRFEAIVTRGTTLSALSEIGIANCTNFAIVDIRPLSTQITSAETKKAESVRPIFRCLL